MAEKRVFEPTKENLVFSGGIVQQLDDLVVQRKQWESTDYQKANEGLYSLLARCLEVFNSRFLKGSEDDRKTLRRDLVARLKTDGIKVQSNSTTLTVFVRFVFGSDRKRAHGYTYVLKAAISHGIDSPQLPAWLIEQGGIEEVKRRMVADEDAIARKLALEEAKVKVISDLEAASKNPIAKVAIPGISGEFGLLLVRPSPDGVSDVVAALSPLDDVLRNAMLARLSKQRLAIDSTNEALKKEHHDLMALQASNDQNMRKIA
jgi:hypothetical protein